MIDVKVHAKPYGTCPHCGIDIGTGEKPEQKPAKKTRLSGADILYRFIMYGLVSLVVLALLNQILGGR